MVRLLLVVLTAFALTSCGGAASPELAPTAGRPDPGSALRGEDLPGRLLFVQQGVIWQWRGAEARPLLGAGEAFQPAWSPSGERIAYVARTNSASDLMLADSSGASLGPLTANSSSEPPNSLERVYASRWAWYPTWAPDGQSIAVASQAMAPVGDPPADYNLGLYVVASGGSAGLPLYADNEAHCGRSAFSPGGQTLVFARAASGAEGQQQLFRLDLASAMASPLPGAPSPSYDPAFSPDARWLAFAARDGARTDIFALPADASASAPLRLTEQGAARAPAFSPDGRLLAFLAVAPGEAGFDVWVADLRVSESGALSAGPARRLTNGLGLDADSGLSWAP